MKLVPLFIIMCLCLYSCGSESHIKEYYEDGTVMCTYTLVNGEKNGVKTAYDSKGRMENKLYFVNDSANGPGSEYYPNGNLKSKFTMKMNKFNGLYNGYDSNGHMNYIITYKMGNREGVEKMFNSKDKLITETIWKNNRKKVLKKWNTKNVLTSLIYYNDGEIVYQLLYDSVGNIVAENCVLELIDFKDTVRLNKEFRIKLLLHGPLVEKSRLYYLISKKEDYESDSKVKSFNIVDNVNSNIFTINEKILTPGQFVFEAQTFHEYRPKHLNRSNIKRNIIVIK